MILDGLWGPGTAARVEGGLGAWEDMYAAGASEAQAREVVTAWLAERATAQASKACSGRLVNSRMMVSPSSVVVELELDATQLQRLVGVGLGRDRHRLLVHDAGLDAADHGTAAP